MQIEHISIRNFRGIRELDWHVGGKTICLVGPGDSTKTTILDAVELALCPSWCPPLADTDFYNLDPQGGFSIEITVSSPPAELITEGKYGLYLRGYDPAGRLLDDPTNGVMPVLTIRLQVGPDLEPGWHVVKPPGSKEIHSSDRERFGASRLGEDTRRDLTWARGSALTRMADQQRIGKSTIAHASRAAASSIKPDALTALDEAVKRATKAFTEIGLAFPLLRPSMDMQSMRMNAGAIALHNGPVPLRAVGLGSRRLACLAVQELMLLRTVFS